jgi:hypothetical protein
MRVRLPGFVLTALVVGASVLTAADRPPQDLHKVGDHWTAWNPPAVPEGQQVHVIARGDTLWDLAGKYLGNPYLWPQIWERNQYILDAHWIYPGDPLALGLEVAPVDHLSEAGPLGPGGSTPGDGGGAPMPPPPDGALSPGEAAGSPVALGAESDIYCSGYVGDMEEQFPYRVLGSEYDAQILDSTNYDVRGKGIQGGYGAATTVKFGLATGDVIYVDGGRAAGLSPGTQFTVVVPGPPVTHPVLRQVVGRFYRYLGRVRILSVQESTAIAEITQTCDPIVVGAFLTPFQPEPVPLGRSTAMRPVNYPASQDKLDGSPSIVYAKDDILALGADHVVHIDLGEADVTPGDMYTIYRENRPGMPPIVLGELTVLSVHKHFSVAKIIESRYPIRLGDRLDPK